MPRRQVDIEIKQGKVKVETLELSTKESEEFERIYKGTGEGQGGEEVSQAEFRLAQSGS